MPFVTSKVSGPGAAELNLEFKQEVPDGDLNLRVTWAEEMCTVLRLDAIPVGRV